MRQPVDTVELIGVSVAPTDSYLCRFLFTGSCTCRYFVWGGLRSINGRGKARVCAALIVFIDPFASSWSTAGDSRCAPVSRSTRRLWPAGGSECRTPACLSQPPTQVGLLARPYATLAYRAILEGQRRVVTDAQEVPGKVCEIF